MKDRTINFRTKKIDKALSDNIYEYCSICWTITNTKKETPVEFRDCYVEGVGQLCSACYLNLDN